MGVGVEARQKLGRKVHFSLIVLPSKHKNTSVNYLNMHELCKRFDRSLNQQSIQIKKGQLGKEEDVEGGKERTGAWEA